MHEEDKLAELIGKANRASGLLNEEAFTEAIASVTRNLMERWEHSQDPNERERIWMSVDNLNKICAVLKTAVVNGTKARREIDDIVSGKKRQHFGVV